MWQNLTKRTKYKLSFAVMVVGLIGALRGILLIQSEGWSTRSMVPGITLLLASVCIGVAGGVTRNYYRVLVQRELDTGGDIAIKTLSNLGREQAKQPKPDVLPKQKTSKP
jgi:hypothetical protein